MLIENNKYVLSRIHELIHMPYHHVFRIEVRART